MELMDLTRTKKQKEKFTYKIKKTLKINRINAFSSLIILKSSAIIDLLGNDKHE